VAKVDAKLAAGRPPGFRDDAFWQNLFRMPSLIIEGRVPVPASESYLLNSRLNVGRELVAVTFTPTDESQHIPYNELCDGLIVKGCVIVTQGESTNV
jgi:hypothetical protein